MLQSQDMKEIVRSTKENEETTYFAPIFRFYLLIALKYSISSQKELTLNIDMKLV